MYFSKEKLFYPVPQQVYYCYASRSPMLEKMMQQGIIHKAIKGLPKTYEALKNLLEPNIKTGTILIVDDGLSELGSSSYLPQVFEELTHATNTMLIFVSQATFLNSSTFRRLSGN